jgi:protease-4
METKESNKTKVRDLLISLVMLSVIIALGSAIIMGFKLMDRVGLDRGSNGGNCNIAKIDMYGYMADYIPSDVIDVSTGNLSQDIVSSEDIVDSIEQAKNDNNVKAIVLNIDSVGGSPYAGEEIMNALLGANKPTVAVIRGIGTSAAYLAATGADTIYASELSDVGGIGVTQSYLEEYEKNEKEGLSYVQLSFGRFKDAGNPAKKITEEEKELFMRDISKAYELLVRYISDNRKLPPEEVRNLADGSSMMGKQALESGLIDKIGGLNDVLSDLDRELGGGVVCDHGE